MSTPSHAVAQPSALPQRASAAVRQPALLRPLAVRPFRQLWIGESVSVLGDQCYLVALPWLTFHLTGSGLALGTVLMTAALPRAVFMLLGGALSDRVSPRLLMLGSNAARAILAGLLAVLVLLGVVQLWHLYALALGFGLADAFFYPAFRTILPRLIAQEQLEAGNALLQGTAQVGALAGPAVAGVVIATLGSWWPGRGPLWRP